jgi:hypothetical protein
VKGYPIQWRRKVEDQNICERVKEEEVRRGEEVQPLQENESM